MFYWAVTRARPAAGQRFIFFTGHENDPKMNFFFKPVKATVLFKPSRLEELDAAIREVPSQVSLTYEYADMFDGYPRTELANLIMKTMKYCETSADKSEDGTA